MRYLWNPQAIPINENTLQLPINAYGNTKLIIEKVLKDYGLAYGLSSISFRYFNAAGASSDGLLGENHNPETHLIPLALKATEQKSKPLIIYGNDYPTKDGTCIRDYIHVEDLAKAHIIGLEKLLNSKENIIETYNLAMGKGFSVLDIIKSVEQVTNKKVNYIFGERRVGDPDKLIADPTKAYKDLNWKAEYTEIDTIIKHAWNWHKKLTRNHHEKINCHYWFGLTGATIARNLQRKVKVEVYEKRKHIGEIASTKRILILYS